MLTIGFSKKYYTLWDCYTEINTLPNGVKVTKNHNIYLKNISFNREKAEKLYPEAKFDETLKGVSRSFTRTFKEYPDNVFKYGRYEGKLFKEVTDYDYMKWYFTTTTEDQQRQLRMILEVHGYYFFTQFDGTLGIMSAEEREEELKKGRENFEKKESILETMTLHIDHNVDSEGEYLDESGIRLVFEGAREMWYQGWTYYLPVINGKCTRIKNKNIKITDYEIDGDSILVKKIEIVK